MQDLSLPDTLLHRSFLILFGHKNSRIALSFQTPLQCRCICKTGFISYLNEKRIQAVRQTIYADIDILTDAGFDIVVVKSTQNQYFMGNRLFEYPELKMLTDAVASSKIISRRKSEALIRKLCHLTSTYQASQLEKLASLSSRVKPDNEKVYYIIDTIYAAVLDHRQIRFQYYEYTQSKEKVLKHDGY